MMLFSLLIPFDSFSKEFGKAVAFGEVTKNSDLQKTLNRKYSDEIVPVSENTNLLEKRLNLLGWELEVIHKSGIGHHPHSSQNPKPIVDFILKNTEN